MGKPVTWFEIHGSADLQRFYADLFDWHVDANNPMSYGMIDTHGEGGINGGIATDEESWVTVYVEVDDLQAAIDKAEQLGGRSEGSGFEPSWRTRSLGHVLRPFRGQPAPGRRRAADGRTRNPRGRWLRQSR